MNFQKFHKEFRVNDKSFLSTNELFDFSNELPAEVQLFLAQWFDEKTFIEVKTSGSTGAPKTIKLQKKHLKNSAQMTGAYFKLDAKTKALLCMSATYIAGKMMLVRAVELGWHIDIVEPCSNPLKKIGKTYDFCAMVPYQLHHSINDLEKIKTLIVGGGAVPFDLLHKIQPLKTKIYATYGMTETITHIAVKKLNNHALEKCFFQVLEGVQISMDERGCLAITAKQLSDELIVTNDLVALVSENEFEWLGRFDNIINSGGVKHIPEQIEKKLESILQQRFFIVGVNDKVLGEKIVLMIEGEKDQKIVNQIAELTILNRYEKPKEIFFIKNFTETATGKINRMKTMTQI